MREAAFDGERVLRPKQRGKARKGRLVRACFAPLGRVLIAYPARTSTAALFTLVLSGIVCNAVLLQKGHHPAPLFGTGVQKRAAEAPIASIPLPRPRPEIAVTGSISNAVPAEASRASETDAALPSNVRADDPAVRTPDGITRLLHRDGLAKREPTGAKASGDVLLTQRALQKLGYDVIPNGHMGPATRRAVQAFERDRHLPIGEDLSPRILHELAGAAGSR